MKKRIAAIILCSFNCAAFTGCIQDNLENQSSIPEKTIVSAYEEQNDIIFKMWQDDNNMIYVNVRYDGIEGTFADGTEWGYTFEKLR